MGFCVESISLEPMLRASDGIVRAESLAVTRDASKVAQQLIRNAHAEADEIRQAASAESDELREAARIELDDMREAARIDAQQVVHSEQQQVIEKAAHLLQSLEHANATFIDRARDVVMDLAQNLFDRLVADTTPREQIEAMLRRVLQEAPPKLVTPLLKVHPDDVDLVPKIDWDIKADRSLARGTCLLEASNGQWRADFSAGLGALKSVFVRTIGASEARADEANASEEESGPGAGQHELDAHAHDGGAYTHDGGAHAHDGAAYTHDGGAHAHDGAEQEYNAGAAQEEYEAEGYASKDAGEEAYEADDSERNDW
ncbi:MAG: hypothetical protein JWM42_2623 [Burkholderia sp.]|nr:hypothetical protein [Burkholderia sp.]